MRGVTTAVDDARTATCCGDATEHPMGDEDARALAALLKALADPARVRLVALISHAPGQEACVCDLTAPLGLAQPTVSHHLKVLVDAGLLTREQRGRWVYYSTVPAAVSGLVARVAALAPEAIASQGRA